jgi:hypothetical protein
MSFAIDTFDKDRFGLITGSRCSVLLPERGDGKKGMTSYAKQLAKEMFFQFYDEVTTWEMEHGKMAESFAFGHYHDHTSKRIEKGRFIKKGNRGGTIDAEIPGLKGIDFKCPTSLDKWLDYMYEPLDKDQREQCQMYMDLTGYKEWDIAAYLTETEFMNNNGLTYPVPEKDRMIIVTVKHDSTWAWRIEQPEKFVIQKRDEYLEKLKAKFKNRTLTPSYL